jgi:alcohol dehydrogenase class IV
MINKEIHEFPIIYSNSNPIGKIAIGWGVHLTVADECKAANIKKALIVTTGLKRTGIVDEIKSILNYNGVPTEVYNKVTSNPKDYQVMEGYKVFKESGCDGVVSVGGGSSHDCGKGIRIVAANDGAYICDLSAEVGDQARAKALKFKIVTIPQISVNTTAGTGAELTPPALIKNTNLRVGQSTTQGIMMRGAACATALIDPLLVRLMPQEFAAWTGWDALAHALDSFLARTQSQYTHTIQLGTMQIIAENLREFVHNRMNHVACEKMCWAESMAAIGILFGGGGGIVHGLGGGICSRTDAHHGRSNAVVTLTAERFNEPACPERFAEMARAMGVDTRGMTTMQAADKWFDEIERLLADLDIKSGHLSEQFGLKHGDLEEMAAKIGGTLGRFGNPREVTYEEALKLYESMM